MDPVDVDFRVVGEDRWAPFKRWLAPKIVRLSAWAMSAVIAGVVIYTIRLIGPHPSL